MTETTMDVAGVSLGMVIIDEIHMPNREPLIDVIGGSATFVTLGQRLFTKRPSEVGCLVIAGDDELSSVRSIIEQWGITTVFKTRKGQPSSRGKLVYQDDTFGLKTFQYMHPPLRASPSDLLDTPLLRARAFHLFGTPTEIMTHVPKLLDLRKQYSIYERPLVVWEPLPASCVPENYQDFLSACKFVDVFSPNHLELASLCGGTLSNENTREELEQNSQKIADAGIGAGEDGVIITRASDLGSLSLGRDARPIWLPAYYSKGSQKVIDPTGAGNTFLGGYIAGWLHHQSVVEAGFYGHVAASFALEQIGLPKVERKDSKIVCNGVKIQDRLDEYKSKVGEASVRSEGML